MWAFNIFVVEFGLTIALSVICYLIWRAVNPGKNF